MYNLPVQGNVCASFEHTPSRHSNWWAKWWTTEFSFWDIKKIKEFNRVRNLTPETRLFSESDYWGFKAFKQKSKIK